MFFYEIYLHSKIKSNIKCIVPLLIPFAGTLRDKRPLKTSQKKLYEEVLLMLKSKVTWRVTNVHI